MRRVMVTLHNDVLSDGTHPSGTRSATRVDAALRFGNRVGGAVDATPRFKWEARANHITGNLPREIQVQVQISKVNPMG